MAHCGRRSSNWVALFLLSAALLSPIGPSAATPSVAPRAARPARPAPTGKVPVYRDPPSYRGIRKAPPTRQVTGPKVTLSSTGNYPDVYVDEAGTAHIIWNESRGDDADVVSYCRLKRNARTCDATATLSWDKTYDVGDGPEFNTDPLGPRIVRVGDQLLVLSFRYPTVSDKPVGGPSANTMVAWISNDGGTSWSDAEIVGRTRLGQVAVTGPDDDPVVVNLAQDPFCEPPGDPGDVCVSAIRSGTYLDDDGTLSPAPDADYFPTVVPDGRAAVAAMTDSAVSSDDGRSRIWLRRWNGADPVTSPTSWSRSAPVLGDEPDLASGPAGLYLLHRRDGNGGFPGPLLVRRLGADLSPGPATRISGESVHFGQLEQDAQGRLMAVWSDGDYHRVLMRATEPRDIDFGAPRNLLTSSGESRVGQLNASITDDGGGFVVANRTGWLSEPGQVVAVPVGSLAPTGRLGLGDLPGGGNVSCKRVDFGSFQIETVSGCFLKGKGAHRHEVVSRGAVTLNGLEIVPTPGSRLVIDAEKLTLDTLGQVRVLLRNATAEVELFRGKLFRDLSAIRPGTRLFEFPRELFRAQVLGFPISSAIPIELTTDGVRIPVEVALPKEFLGFNGRAVLRGRTGTGLELESLDVAIGPVPLGLLTIDDVEVQWQSGGTWSGQGDLTFPVGGRLHAEVRFEMGDFASAGFSYTPDPAVPIGPFLYLTEVDGALQLRPDTVISAGASVGAGAPVFGATPVTAHGTFTMRFPRSGPATFRMEGSLEVLLLAISHGFVEYNSDGYATFRGGAELSLGPISGHIELQGYVDGRDGAFGVGIGAGASYCTTWMDPRGELPPQDVCGDVPPTGADAGFALSNIGFAACATIDPPVGPSFSSGIASRWSDVDPAALLSPVLLTAEVVSAISVPCHTGDYFVPPPARGRAAHRARAAGGAGFEVPADLPSATIRVDGVDAVPELEVRGPDGSELVGSRATGDDVRMIGMPGTHSVWIAIDRPAPGTYTVEPASGSSALDQVLLSRGYRPAGVHGTVRPGRIRYHVSGLTAGQSVRFQETGSFGTRTLCTARSGKHTCRFRPLRTSERQRTVEALVQRDGVTIRTVRIGRYRAPSPVRPGRIRHLRVRTSGSRVVVTWDRPRHAAGVTVRVTGNAGSVTERSLPASARRLRLDGWRWDTRITITAQGRSALGLPGPKARVTYHRRH